MSEMIAIGKEESFPALPAEVMLEDTPYWLVRASDGDYRLLMALCPHAGGEVRPIKDSFFCPLHFWTFHAEDGHCTNVPGESLMKRDVRLQDGVLYAIGANY